MPNSLPPSSSVPGPPSRQPSLVPKESMSNQAIETKSASSHTESQPSSTTQGNNSGYSILEDNQKATRPHLFFKLRQEAQLTSSTSSRPWVSSAQPLIGQPVLMSGQETHYYYATEYQMVFIEKLEGMRKELCRDEMKEVQEYDGRWFICAVCGGILGACIIFRGIYLESPKCSVRIFAPSRCMYPFLGSRSVHRRKSKLFEWPRHAIL